jgi:dTDP-4-dehydrorhamnose reductase
MAKILITGADGQLGQCFKWIEKEFSKHILFFARQNEVDILSPWTISKYYDTSCFDIIINCAAYTNVDLAETELKKALQLNLDGIKNLKVFAEEKQIKLIHFSTDFVFDGTKKKPYNETDIPNPLNKYGETKLAGEMALKKAKCSHVTIRLSWLYSPFGNNFVRTIIKMSRLKDSLQVVNDQWGKPTYGIDLARHVLNNIDHPRLFKYDIYHYAQGPKTNWYKFAASIVDLLEEKCLITPISSSMNTTTANRPLNAVLETKRIEECLNLQVRDWSSALAECIKNLKNDVI